jgi:hypothetical protein
MGRGLGDDRDDFLAVGGAGREREAKQEHRRGGTEAQGCDERAG